MAIKKAARGPPYTYTTAEDTKLIVEDFVILDDLGCDENQQLGFVILSRFLAEHPAYQGQIGKERYSLL